jgi:glutathionylspermidine synthase
LKSARNNSWNLCSAFSGEAEHESGHIRILTDRSPVKRSTLADANETRDWRIYSDFAQHLIQQARLLYQDVDLGLELEGTLYALDSSIIDVSLKLFPWAPHQRSRAAIKLNTLLDIQSAIPTLIDVTGAHSGDSQDVGPHCS